jgi:hypothetical protein
MTSGDCGKILISGASKHQNITPLTEAFEHRFERLISVPLPRGIIMYKNHLSDAIEGRQASLRDVWP